MIARVFFGLVELIVFVHVMTVASLRIAGSISGYLSSCSNGHIQGSIGVLLEAKLVFGYCGNASDSIR